MLFCNICALLSTSLIVLDIQQGRGKGKLHCAYGQQWDHKLEESVSCKDGFLGADCNSTCQNMRYGRNCELKCNCTNQDCHHIHGCKKHPSECDDGKFGLYCEIPCRFPAFGKGCQKKCSSEKHNCDTKRRCIVATAASASSVYGGTNNSLWNAENAVDGIVQCGPDGPVIIAHTAYQKNPWLKVSLNNTSNVERVLIYNRQDCCVVATTASSSSVFDDSALFKASNAIDGSTRCEVGDNINLAHTNLQINPWLKVSLINTSIVERVLIYNRQDCCGERLHDVRVYVTENGRNVSCGFYPGPAVTGDRILFLCEKDTRGNGVTISILSKDGQPDYLHACEVEIYGRT